MARDPADSTRSPGPTVSADALRAVMGHFTSGVTVVTAAVDGVQHAMTATAVCSVSLDPPLVLVCVGHVSRFHAAITAARGWALSVLSSDQAATAAHFAHSGRDLRTQFDDIEHHPAPVSGAPVIGGSLAWLDLVTDATHEAGDHTIVVGRVVGAGWESAPVGPLTYYLGTYRDAPDPR